jgi:signal transduction histidine kinase
MMRPARSLLWQVALLQVIAVAALSIVLPLGMKTLLRSTAVDYERARLHRHEQAIAKALRRTPEGGWRLDLPSDLQGRFSTGHTSFVFAIIDGRGRVLFSSLPAQGSLFLRSTATDRPTFRQLVLGRALYYGGSFPERVGGETVWVQIGQNLDSPDVLEDDVVSTFIKRAGWLIVPILGVLVLVDFIIVRQSLRPVLEASDLAKAIGPASLSLRLPSERLPREIEPLAEAVNEALDRLEQGFRMQREFTADAAHELRTPLAVLRLRVGEIKDKALARTLAADIDVMARIVGQLLDVAELEAFVPNPEERADLADVGRRVVEYLAPLAAAKSRSLALAGAEGPVWVWGESEFLFQAVRNLVENAIGHSAPKTTVEVRLEPPGMIHVLDRGPGVAEAERELLFRRFWRRERSTSGGAGLGLAIVSRIVNAHGGQVSVRNRSGGGAAFTVRLNAAPEPARRPRASRQATAAAE